MWHIFIMERIDQMENKQKPVERETRQLIQTYNVLLKSQIYAYFAKTQRDHFVGRTFKTLEKEKQIYIHQDLEIYDILYVSENEVQVTNNLFTRKMTDDCGHIVIVEKPGYIHEIRIPDVLGFCTVKEGGEIEYYRNADG